MYPPSHFKVLQKFKPSCCLYDFTQYESDRTGMRVAIIDQRGPKVTGFFTLATEIHDDSGAPHTLEHLCLRGSRSYPYSRFLGKLARRTCSEINAWTSTCDTTYILDAAGWMGFAQILPVYLEHIIAPTLSDKDCYTEVHHIDGTGNDAGVVYSEKQGTQNVSEWLIDRSAKRSMYPEDIGLRYDVGGTMEQLRILTPERIREFHRDMYQPKKLCMVISGEVDHSSLLETLDKFEDTILDIIPSPEIPSKRPWVESGRRPLLEKSILRTVEYPGEDDAFGKIETRFLGPDYTDTIQGEAVRVALLYLTGSPASPLAYILVEKEQVASTVDYIVEEYSTLEIQFALTGVQPRELERVEKRFFEVLRETVGKALDMKYLHACIDLHRRNWKFSMESPESFAPYVTKDFLFGKRDGSTVLDVATLKDYEVLLKWSEDDWSAFIGKWISDAPHVSILGVPSPKLCEKLKMDEEARIAVRKKQLGDERLKNLAEKVKKVRAENDRAIPREMLSSVKIPTIESIHFLKTTMAKSGAAVYPETFDRRVQKLVDADSCGIPLFIHFEHIPSRFAQISLLISIQSVPIQLRPLLLVYVETFFKLPIQRNGKVISFDQVVVELLRDTVGYLIDSGDSFGNSEMLRISFTVESQKYGTAVDWLQQLSWSSVFDIERLRAIVNQLLHVVPDAKTSGDGMVEDVHIMVHYAAESAMRASSTLVRARYLQSVNKLLTGQPDIVKGYMEQVRNCLFKFENIRVLVIADLEKITNPVSSWRKFAERLGPSSPLQPITSQRASLSTAGQTPGRKSYIIPMSTIESSFAKATARGFDSYNNPNYPALLVAEAYMCAEGGPLWNYTRGEGLAYNAYFDHDIDHGFVHFTVFRSQNVSKVLKIIKETIQNHLSGQVPFDALMLEGAISSILHMFASDQATFVDAAKSNFIRQVVRNLPSDYQKLMLEKVRCISVTEVKEVLHDIFLPLFMPESANIVVTYAPRLEEEVKYGLESLSFMPEILPLEEFEDNYGLKTSDQKYND